MKARRSRRCPPHSMPDGFRVGLSICYDLRFPELYRSLGACDLLVVPAAFTETTGRRTGNPAARPRHREPVLRAGHRRRAAVTRTVARRTATACSSTRGNDPRPQAERAPASSSATSIPPSLPRCRANCRRCNTVFLKEIMRPLRQTFFPVPCRRCWRRFARRT